MELQLYNVMCGSGRALSSMRKSLWVWELWEYPFNQQAYNLYFIAFVRI